jgi:hypothetical protein
MTFYIIWTILFAAEFKVLKSNSEDVEGYAGVGWILGHIILAFENGIGNINNPTVENWMNEDDEDIIASA